MGDTMKLAHEKTTFGVTRSVLTTTTGGNEGQRVIENVKVGNKFWGWASIPPGYGLLSGIDFSFGTGFSWGDGAPTCMPTAAENNAILAELAEFGPAPADVLTPRQV